MTSTMARPLDTAGTRTDTVLSSSATPDLLGALASLQEHARLRHIESLTTDIFAWLDGTALDADDRREFLRDLVAALKSNDLDDVAVVVREWRVTADALHDDLARETLLGPGSPDDYIEVERPA